jgi:hypothetical protein
MRYFGVININDKNAQTFIDGIRLLCASRVKHKAHITLQGPKNDKNEIKFGSIRRNEQIVYVNGVGNFFSEGQNTVYLKCDLDNNGQIKSMLDKPDFGNENPHITLYDGDNRNFAESLYNLTQTPIYKDKIRFQIIVSENNYNVKQESDLGIISSSKEYLTFDSTFYNHLSYYLGGTTINENIIENLSEKQRLEYVKHLLSLFANWQNNKVIANPCIKVINELNLTEQNGLFFYDDIRKWSNFPTNIKQAIYQAKPYAFFTLQDINEEKRFDTELPFVFIYSNPTEEEEEIIRRKVFNFGNAPILIIHKSDVKIINGLIYNKHLSKVENLLDKYKLSDFSYDQLVTQSFWDKHVNNYKEKGIYHSFLKNITETRNYLIYEENLSKSVCNRLIGRLLFIRYFIDRGVSFRKEDGTCFFNASKEQFAETVKDKDALYSFFTYFKDKYNGDLFPVDDEEVSSVTNRQLKILSILFKGGKFNLQKKNFYIQESLFDIYDFSIIPIELVSNVYESFMGEYKSEKRKDSIQVKNKAFYTPFVLADFVLENTIGKYLRQNNIKHDFTCPVLDPSCGSGIFLVEALRKIIERKIELKKDILAREEIWDCVSDNIYGIDIDKDAIDIAIFSIYVTILDYISPLEISENFKFRNLKNTNFFNADFFNLDNTYNTVLKDIQLKFIIGNPPWGQIKESPYMDYCAFREQKETIEQSKIVDIDISDKQIAQAFLIRVSDFLNANKTTSCSFVVTSKLLYNTNAKKWRKYFLDNFSVSEIYDFSPVRNSIFEDAAWPTMIIFYSPKSHDTFEHFSITAKNFSKKFKSFSIDQQSTKVFSQKELHTFNTHYNWFWKTLVYGSFFDFLIIKKMKEQYRTIFDYIEDYGLQYGVGLKRNDGIKKQDASNLIGYKFIDTHNKELQQFIYNSSNTWNEETAGNVPNLRLFLPPLALIKEGLTSDFKGVAAFSNEEIVFTHSVRAIKGNKNDIEILKSIVGLMNSDLFSYYILHTGSSVGVDLTRANQIEQFAFPAILSKEISVIVDKITNIDKELVLYNEGRRKFISELNDKIFELYNFKPIEKDFINYTLKYVIPLIKQSVTKRINSEHELYGYATVFSKYLSSIQAYYNISYHISKEFIGVFFTKSDNQTKLTPIEDKNLISILNLYSNLTYEQISKSVFIKKNVIEISIDRNSYCIIKPNRAENWQNANAWLDLVVFLKDMTLSDKNFCAICEDLFNE